MPEEAVEIDNDGFLGAPSNHHDRFLGGRVLFSMSREGWHEDEVTRRSFDPSLPLTVGKNEDRMS